VVSTQGGPNTQKRVAVPTPENAPSPAPFGSQGKPFEAPFETQGKQGKGVGHPQKRTFAAFLSTAIKNPRAAHEKQKRERALGYTPLDLEAGSWSHWSAVGLPAIIS
jgi:hypothetical protein